MAISRNFINFAITKGSRIKVNSKFKYNIKYYINNNKIKYKMEIIYNIIQTTLDSFDFTYCIIVNILTYIIINIINSRNGNIDMNTWNKRVVLFICIIIISVFYYFSGSDTKTLLNSAIITPVFWSWIMKPICRRFKIDYKQLSLFE